MTRRTLLSAGLICVSVVFMLACGEATLRLTAPAPTPDGTLDCTFRGGVMEALSTRDCGNSGCHLDPGQAELTLVSATKSDDVIYYLLLNSGGTSQQNSNCGGESQGCQNDPGNPPNGEYCCQREVRPNHPAYSLLLNKPYADSNETHGGGKQFGSDQDTDYLAIKCWIEDGAPNN